MKKENKLTNTESYVLEMIEKDPKFFISNNLKALSKHYNVGEATIIRLISKLDFASLKEMQMKYASKINLNNLMNIKPSSSIENITNNIISFQLYSILETKELLDLNELEEISNKIINSKYIGLFGIGNSYISASYFANALNRIGYNAKAWQFLDDAFSLINFMDPEKDLVIIYSSSGKTKEALAVFNYAFEHNIKVVWITSFDSKNNDSDLQKSDYKLFHAYHKSESLKFPSVTTSNGQILISNILFNIVLNSSSENIDKLINANKAIIDWNEK